MKQITPIQFISETKNVQLFIKRDDLNHSLIQGNKYWKLQLNIQKALRQGKKNIITFGGAYSNHIYATAAAGKAFGIKTIGIIRGERNTPLNFTLCSAENFGMELHFISRSSYKQKHQTDFLEKINQQFPHSYIVPEGGTNHLAIQGCQQLAQEIQEQGTYDYIIVPVGTGGTIAGLITGFPETQKILGISSLKGSFLTEELKNIIFHFNQEHYSNWKIINDYHFGGYAKHKPELIDFINQFQANYNIPLDPIYTGKMMYGIMDMIAQGKFPEGSRILAIHTGGLQGIRGFNERFGNIIH